MNEKPNHESVRRLLLVEDDDVDAMMFERAVRKHGLPVTVDRAIDGAEGIEYLEDPAREFPDLCVLDLNMPRVGGVEFLRRLRNVPNLRVLPVFVLTTSSAPDDIADAYEHWIAGYFIKDVETVDLDGCMAVLNEWLSSPDLCPRAGAGPGARDA